MKLKKLVGKKLKNRIGKYKVLISRLMSYLSIVNFFMILYLFAKEEPLGLHYQIWLIFAAVICCCVIVFDSLFVIEGDANYNFARTPRMVAHEQRVIKILEILEEKK